MNIPRKVGRNIAIISLLILTFSSPAAGEIFYNFDDLPPTAPNEIPGSGGGFLYTSPVTNPDNAYPMTQYNLAGWRDTVGYPGNTSIKDYFTKFNIGSNTDHIGFENYGYLEIDNATAISGNSLRYRITGGKNSTTLPGANGLPLHSKEKYLEYVTAGQSPVEGGIKVGTPYMYFANTGPNSADAAVPFWQAKNANRLSFYVKTPERTNGPGGYGSPPLTSMTIGPYSNIGQNYLYPNGDPSKKMSGHWYHHIYTQGGGWTHVMVDAHPNHHNGLSSSSSYPYPSWSLRGIGSEYFKNMWKLYITAYPYEGIAIPPFSLWIDEMEFINDPEPQNNETINSPSVMYLPDQKLFEIGFSDKYKNNQYSYSTYEVRYSFSPITNANWGSAKPVHIQADSRFGISDTTNGKFKKWWPYYQSVWAPFKLAPADELTPTPGTTVYFAIKDVSQESGNGANPVGGDNTAGRRYAEFPDLFDYAGDQTALNLIKRIDYFIPPNQQNPDTTPPDPPTNLAIEIIAK